MMSLGLWLKNNDFRVDQVQNFYPSPMASATTMYYTEKNPLKPLGRNNDERIFSAKTQEQRTLHKAFLRYHDPKNWPLLRDTLKDMGREDLIGNGKMHLVPPRQPGKRHGVVEPGGRPSAGRPSGGRPSGEGVQFLQKVPLRISFRIK